MEKVERLELMRECYPLVTARTALAAFRLISHLHLTYGGVPPKEVTVSWKALIDAAAAKKMSAELHRLPFQTIKVGSEGDKEIQYAGEAAASVKGTHGLEKFPELWGVSDVVEGTSPASENKPGASSVIAVTSPEGIMPTPEGVHYMVKLIAPPQANGVMSLDQPHQQNLDNLLQVLGIKAHELTQVTMDPNKPGREINQQYVEAAIKVGVKTTLINAGDFMPGIRATLDPLRFGTNPLVLVGRGGFEEGIMAAVSARIFGAFMHAREFHKDQNLMDQKPLWMLDNLVPEKKDTALVSASFITDDDLWFHQPGIKIHRDGSYDVTTLVITHKGLEFRKRLLT